MSCNDFLLATTDNQLDPQRSKEEADRLMLADKAFWAHTEALAASFYPALPPMMDLTKTLYISPEALAEFDCPITFVGYGQDKLHTLQSKSRSRAGVLTSTRAYLGSSVARDGRTSAAAAAAAAAARTFGILTASDIYGPESCYDTAARVLESVFTGVGCNVYLHILGSSALAIWTADADFRTGTRPAVVLSVQASISDGFHMIQTSDGCITVKQKPATIIEGRFSTEMTRVKGWVYKTATGSAKPLQRKFQ
jgi:hypothetical protein